jgi:AP-5 complex subunit zeta-1
MSRLKGGGFFKASSTQAPTTELDGKPTSEMFTVLSASFDYSYDQLLNIQAFCSIRSWLMDMYVVAPSQQEELLTRKLDPVLRDCVVEYSVRVLNQSRLLVDDDPSASRVFGGRNNSKALVSLCLSEAVRVLDVLCSLESSLVPRIFPLVRAASPNQTSLEVLEFILHHAPLSSDCDALFRTFFNAISPDDPIAAHNIIAFCNRNCELLKSRTNVFVSYFPAFLKLLAWNPLSLLGGVSSLLSSMISSDTFLELVHSVLDLPLIAASMEDVMYLDEDASMLDTSVSDFSASMDQPNEDGGLPISTPEKKENDPFRPLAALMLRNESGVTYNMWDGDVTIIQAFCKSKSVSIRVVEVGKVAPVLLGVLCDVLLASDLSDEHLEQLLRVLFLRMNKLFPIPNFEGKVRHVLENKVLAVFHALPSLVDDLRPLIISAIASATFSASELTLNLCWIVGEHASVCGASVIREYHEVLELFTYERLSMAKIGGEEDFIFQSRLMLSLVSCLSKLAAAEQSLVSRVVLCLSKILNQSSFHDAVYVRCRECIRLLRIPHLASVIFGARNQYKSGKEERFDEMSSIAMLKKPRCPEIPNVVTLCGDD